MVDLESNSLREVRGRSNASIFHVWSTDDGSITGIPQLVFNATRSDSREVVEYSAWIKTSASNGANSIQFFNASASPGSGSGYGIVTATFSTYLCRLVLITWMMHDLSYPLNCGGELWLGGGSIVSGCMPVNVTVSSALN